MKINGILLQAIRLCLFPLILATLSVPARAGGSQVDTMVKMTADSAKTAADDFGQTKATFTRTFTKTLQKKKPTAEQYYKAEAAKAQIATASNSYQQGQNYEKQAEQFAKSDPKYAEHLRNLSLESYQKSKAWLRKANDTMGAPSAAPAPGPSAGPPPVHRNGYVCGGACQQLEEIANQPVTGNRLPDFENITPPRPPANLQPAAHSTPFFQKQPAQSRIVQQGGKETLVLPKGNTVDLTPVKTAVAAVNPALANKPLFVSCGGGSCPSRALVKTMADPQESAAIKKIGGVALAATFDILAISGYSEFSSGGRLSITDRPTLVSLKALAKAVAPYADQQHWRNLPENLRYPGNISRVTGFVYDKANDDLILVGSAAPNPDSRIDIDVIVTCIRRVWRDGKVMAVSLDPRPDRMGGAQYPRLIDVPSRSVAATIMLDADYAMKLIGANAGWAKDVPFVDLSRIYSNFHDSHVISRFWLTPQYLDRNAIYLSRSGNAMLVNTAVQVQTEEESVSGGALVGTGKTLTSGVTFARAFTTNLPAFETDPRIHPQNIFLKLHGLVDLSTLAKIWRNKYPKSRFLAQFAGLPILKLSAADSYPDAFVGVHGMITTNVGDITAQGGAVLHFREGALAETVHKDRITSALENAALGMSSRGMLTRQVDITFGFSESGEGQTVEKVSSLLLQASNAFDNRNYDAAEQAYRQITQIQPAEPEGYAGLAQVALDRKMLQQAARFALIALHLDPDDEQLQLLALDIGWQINPDILESTYSPAQRLELSRYYSKRAQMFAQQEQNAKASTYAQWATDLWEGNGDAYLTLAYLATSKLDRTQDVSLAVQSFRRQVKSGQDGAKESLALALDMLASRHAEMAENLIDAYSAFHTLKGNNTETVEGFFNEALSEVAEGLTYNPTLVDLGATKLLTEAEQRLFKAQTESHGAVPDLSDLAKEAGELYKQHPGSATALDALSGLAQASNNYALAVKYIGEAIKIETRSVQLYIDRAHTEYTFGHCTEATADLKTAAILAGKGANDFDFKNLTSFVQNRNCHAE